MIGLSMVNENTIPVPDWNDYGVIPPINSANPVSVERSPYIVSLLDLLGRFGNTEPRREILSGLLDFRAELHRAGLTQGFQWIDGSFVEDIESLENRPPRDIDVVTFFYIPDGHTQESLVEAFPDIFNRGAMNARFGVDAFIVLLNQTDPEILTESSAYWYGVWSHRRNMLWKGFVQVDLDDGEDERARAALNGISNETGG